MSIVTLHPITQKFMDVMAFAKDHHFAFIDLRLVEIGQAQMEINRLTWEEKEEVKKSFQYALVQMENLGLIYKFKNVDNGFKIYPQNKEYLDESHLYLLFLEDEKDVVA